MILNKVAKKQNLIIEDNDVMAKVEKYHYTITEIYKLQTHLK